MTYFSTILFGNIRSLGALILVCNWGFWPKSTFPLRIDRVDQHYWKKASFLALGNSNWSCHHTNMTNISPVFIGSWTRPRTPYYVAFNKRMRSTCGYAVFRSYEYIIILHKSLENKLHLVISCFHRLKTQIFRTSVTQMDWLILGGLIDVLCSDVNFSEGDGLLPSNCLSTHDFVIIPQCL